MTREERERVWYIIWRSIVVLLCCVDKVQDREKVTSRCWIVMNIVIELNHGPSLGLAHTLPLLRVASHGIFLNA